MQVKKIKLGKLLLLLASSRSNVMEGGRGRGKKEIGRTFSFYESRQGRGGK